MLRTVGSIALLVMLLCATARGGAPQKTPAPDPLLAEASQAVASNTLWDFVNSIEEQVTPLLGDLDKADRAKLTRLAALRELGRYFARIEKPDENAIATVHWLLDHPRLLEALMLSLDAADAPDRVFAVLGALRSAHEEKLDEFADLTTAMCVVWDTPPNFDTENPKADTERAVWLFKYLMMARQRLRFDPKQMPWELLAYVVDNSASQDDVAWAASRYAQRGAIGASYFDVPYDYSAFYGTSEKIIGAHDYTLANLARYGGVCSDQAYFASHVARSIGVPACVAAGLGGASEVGHAWVGYLDSRGHEIVWNFSEGRYPEHLYWKGAVLEPQTRDAITDSDVALLAELARTNPADRLASRAMCKVADLADSSSAAQVYMKAIDLSPGNRLAWMRLAQLGADLKLDENQFAQVTQVVNKFAAKPYPDFAFAVLQKLHSGRGTDQQMRALKQTKTMFNRPDLLASIRLAEGDLLRNQQRTSAALGAYGDVLTRAQNAGPILLAALEKIELMLRESNDLRRLAAIYSQTWARMPQPSSSGYVRSTPYYLIGERYLALLQEIGESAEAQRVRARLNSLATYRASP